MFVIARILTPETFVEWSSRWVSAAYACVGSIFIISAHGRILHPFVALVPVQPNRVWRPADGKPDQTGLCRELRVSISDADGSSYRMVGAALVLSDDLVGGPRRDRFHR